MKTKKNHWLKLDRHFFKRHDVEIIREMPEGNSIVLFYMMLLVESIDHDGFLRVNDEVPYDIETLSIITKTPESTVRLAIPLLERYKLLEVLNDDTLYLSKLQKMLGSIDNSADRVAKHREKLKQINGCNGDVTVTVTNVTVAEKEKEKELDKEKESSSVLALIFKTYEEEIGMVTPILSDDIEYYLTELSKEIIIKAIGEASTRNAKNWKYIKAILDRCIKENIRTIADYESKNKKPAIKEAKISNKYDEIYMN